MSDFKIAAGKNTPLIVYQSDSHMLSITGKSYPEDALSVYSAISKKMLALTHLPSLLVRLDFEYLSSSSVACILQLLKDLKRHHTKTTFSIELFHDKGDDDMISVGENFNQLSGIPVSFKMR